MTPLDSRTQAALQAALQRIRSTAATAASRALDGLGTAALSSTNTRQRDAYLAAQYELGRQIGAFNQRFGEVLVERVTREVQTIRGHAPTNRSLEQTDWNTLSLVEDHEVEELVSADRLGLAISTECEWELRELSTYIGALLKTGRAEQEHNPLRAEIIGKALFRGVESVTPARETRAVLTREIGRVLASMMRVCYADIMQEFQSRGIKPVSLSVRGVDGPGNDLVIGGRRDGGPSSQFDSRYDTGPGEEVLGLPSTSGKPTDIGTPRSSLNSGFVHSGSHGSMGQGGWGGGPVMRRGGGGAGGTRGSSVAPSSWRGETPASRFGGARDFGRRHDGTGFLDPRMVSLIRRLAVLGGAAAESAGSRAEDASPSDLDERAEDPAERRRRSSRGGLTDLVSANLIRAHREELRQAANGAIDHMVIDIVGSLFDQILSDPKVAPQMARQIARLQLPVLRVALGDITFFSSRRHPVRRFVNRIASLACAFDDFGEGPGLELITRVRELVQEIVEGDFDQMGLYESKLAALEQFIARASEDDIERGHSAASLLYGKEHQLRLQQRYTQALHAGLARLQMPDFMREFVSQVWSQAIMRVALRDGPQSEAARRMRMIGRELIMSLQPKGSPAHRKQFLMKLPQLMKDLNEGMALIAWPDAGRKAFFGHLMPAHAESLKGAPLSELDYNMMASELDSLLLSALPHAEDRPQPDPVAIPELAEVVVEQQFTPDEAEKIGLVAENSVDWAGRVDEPDTVPDGLAAARRAAGAQDSSEADTVSPALADLEDDTETDTDVDIDLGALAPSEPPEPIHGASLVDHLQIGMAYQMYLKDSWQKVRLSFISPGRAFFVFTHGKRHQETISMTSRMVARMCETDRLRAFEHAYLLERATHRARKQLAALSAESVTGAFGRGPTTR